LICCFSFFAITGHYHYSICLKNHAVNVITRHQGCSGAGTRGKGVPTPFASCAFKMSLKLLKWLVFWVRSRTFFVSTASLHVTQTFFENRTFVIVCSKNTAKQALAVA